MKLKDIRKLVKAIKNASTSKTQGYDSQATVVRVEDETAWVHIPGGVTETPVKKTIDCKEGDIVQIRVSGGRATITGNATVPPTGDTKAIEAATAAGISKIESSAAKASAEAAEEIAKGAEKVATNYIEEGSEGETKIVNNVEESTTQAVVGKSSFDITEGDSTVASFGADTIELGKNSSEANINMLNGIGRITQFGTSEQLRLQGKNGVYINPISQYPDEEEDERGIALVVDSDKNSANLLLRADTIEMDSNDVTCNADLYATSFATGSYLSLTGAHTKNITVPKSGAYTDSSSAWTVTKSVSGQTWFPMAIGGFYIANQSGSSGESHCNWNQIYLKNRADNSTGISYEVTNKSSSAVKVTMGVYVLWARKA